MATQEISFRSLRERGQSFSGSDQRISMMGVLVGAILELEDTQGLYVSIASHPILIGEGPDLDDTAFRVHAILPGNVSDEENRALHRVRGSERSFYFEGTYKHKPSGLYLGTVQATSWRYDPE